VFGPTFWPRLRILESGGKYPDAQHGRAACGEFSRRVLEVCCENAVGKIFGGTVVISTMLLVCAVVASLGVGVLVAYAVCVSMFEAFRIHARQVAAARVVAVRMDVVEG